MTKNKKCKVCSSLITIRDAYFTALSRFSFLGETDIKILLSHINAIPFSELALHYDEGAKNIDTFFALCEKVNNGYPLQYLIRESEFLGMSFYVDERVLIPRGESEELVVYMTNLIRQENIKDAVIADICTGSGVIGLSLKKALPSTNVVLSDLSNLALEVAAINSEKLDLNVEILQGSSLKPLIEKGIKVDYLVANPPYVNSDDEIGHSVKEYEPALALFSDNKQVYKDIFTDLEKVMRDDTISLMLEINEKDGKLMLELASLILGPASDAKIVKDIHGKDRFIFVRYTK